MKIDKDTIIEFIRSHVGEEKVDDARRELPDEVDTDRDSGLLSKFGVDPSKLLGMMGGDEIGKKLGGLLGD